MSRLTDVYGQDYKQTTSLSKAKMVINNITNNLSHRNFNYRIDTSVLWDANGSIKLPHIIEIIELVKILKPKFELHHINKYSDEINMIHVHVSGTPAEYIIVIDKEYSKVYSIFITKDDIGIL